MREKRGLILPFTKQLVSSLINYSLNNRNCFLTNHMNAILFINSILKVVYLSKILSMKSTFIIFAILLVLGMINVYVFQEEVPTTKIQF